MIISSNHLGNEMDDENLKYGILFLEIHVNMKQMHKKLDMFRLIDHKSHSITEQSGVYYVYYKGKTSQIRRFKKDDTDGLVYIGHASNLKRRISNLLNGLEKNNKEVHSVSKRYNDYYKKILPITDLYIKIEPTDNAKKLESEKLLEYRKKYLDLPVLNSRE